MNLGLMNRLHESRLRDHFDPLCRNDDQWQIKCGSIQISTLDALRKWVEERGLASEEKEVNAIAFLIGRAIRDQGSPTRGAYKYSNNGKRKDWIGQVLEANEQIIFDHIEQASIANVEVRFNKVLIDIDKLIK